MDEQARKWFFAASAMLVMLGALIYFLFVEHPVSPQQSSASAAPVSVKPSHQTSFSPQSIVHNEARSCSPWHPTDTIEPITADKALSRLAAKLALSPVERTGAMGLFLQRLTASKDFLDARPDCQWDSSCSQTATDLGAIRESQYEKALIGIASRTRDPQVYALALLSCSQDWRNSAAGACAFLSAEQWARIEPDNGVPWLQVALASERAHDNAARDNAIRRASSAQSFDTHLPNFLGLLRTPELRGETPETSSDLAADLFSMQMLLPTQPYGLLLRFCNYPAVADQSRIDTCNDLTRLLLEHDKTMLGFSTGVRLAQSANWPPEKVDSLRQRKKAYMEALREKGLLQRPANAASDCEGLENRTTNYEFLGELGVAKSLAE
jgi:hypothetical protein